MPIRSVYTPYDLMRTQKAIEYIHGHYKENTSADQLAIEVNIDIRLLQQIMQFLTGRTIHSYIIKVRLDKATIDLDENFQFTIAEIAYRHGFTSSSHFIRLFKKQTSLTPKEYRYQLLSKGKAVHIARENQDKNLALTCYELP